MRIVTIAAGAAGAYCGACNHDIALVNALRAADHDVTMVALYTPLHTDGPDPSHPEVYLGGLNTYLRHALPLYRFAPRPLTWLLDRPGVLRLLGKMAVRTRPEDLGPLTVDVLRGTAGCQQRELLRLVTFLASTAHPDLVILSNTLLSALAPLLRERLDVPILCSLQGEEQFLDRLPPTHREEAYAHLRSHAQAITLFLSPCNAYIPVMSDLLDVPATRIRTVRPAITPPAPRSSAPPPQPLRVGCLSRISPDKGTDLLIKACTLLHQDDPGGPISIHLAGRAAGPDLDYWRDLQQQVASSGLAGHLHHAGEPDLQAKHCFLAGLHAFVQPSRIPEWRALAALEAQSHGIPIIAPSTGAFPELQALIGGSILVPPDDAQAIATAIATLRDDPDQARTLGQTAATAIREHLSPEAQTKAASRAVEV